ncbi:MarR family winged helix-turn-helix transcriptional regulator [Agromyces badenianii]|uniref:MarR family winged helix-turn-helix transcriptional regulator n=1 Tax=Agromyces badenianii TaxID=2080742 RepID=UPI000D596899|nr:MarR family transcriptional regulator [Agromyces badenianii]PWC02859.1 MarR family transcriptional regulator [Agromyces badenianii]
MVPEITVLDRLLEVSELFQKDMARAFDGTPLTPSRTRLLWELAATGPSTQHALASRLEVSPRNITGLVDALEAGGYVTRSPHPSDRRAIIVSLTRSAQGMMHDMQREHAELSAELLGAVAPADRAALLRGVEAITGRLRELIAADAERQARDQAVGE